jgi:uncharacterized protein YcfL
MGAEKVAGSVYNGAEQACEEHVLRAGIQYTKHVFVFFEGSMRSGRPLRAKVQSILLHYILYWFFNSRTACTS